MGRLLIVLGVVLVVGGLLIQLGVPFGRLPGDMAVSRGRFSFYFPLTTSLIVSVVLTLIMLFIGRR